MQNSIVITGKLFAEMVKGGAASLNNERAVINDLNVFPIPDGDTGDNMYMTIHAGVVEITEPTLSAVSEKIAKGMLLGARGNSGVILSRIFAGIAAGFQHKSEATLSDLADALSCGVKEAYRAVSNPVEGTILTVCREAVAKAAIFKNEDPDTYFSALMEEADTSLTRTPDLLPVLKEAGVVDSGAAGFISILRGMIRAFHGENVDLPEEHASSPATVDLSLFTEDSVLEFGYCTEFLLRLQNAKTDISAFDIDAFTAHLTAIGESVVSFRDGTIVKVHVHTKTPSEVLAYAQKYGEFLTVKIENMTLQHHENEEKKEASRYRVTAHKAYGVVAVAAGDGIKETFRSLGADAVIDGGQCMNPSAEDFVKAFASVPADTVLVFPGEGNVIMAASQAAELYKDATVRVIPTKTIGETYAALSMLDTSSGDTDSIVSETVEAFAGVVTGNVSRAVRDAEMNGVAVKCGDYFGYGKGKIYVDTPTREETVMALAESLNAGKYDVLLLICGKDAPEEEAGVLYNKLSNAYPRTEVIMIDGGQPVNDYILTLE